MSSAFLCNPTFRNNRPNHSQIKNIMAQSTDFETLEHKLKKIHTLSSVNGLLGWDEQVNLPPQSNDQRSEQSSLIATITHNLSSEKSLGETIARIEKNSSSLDPEKQTVLKEARKNFDRATKLPAEFIERKSRLDSEAYHAWAKARENSDYSVFAPYLQKQVDISKEFAGYLEWEDSYNCLIDLHDPGMDSTTIGALFKNLQRDLAPITEQILSSPTKADTSFLKGFAINEQEAFLKEVTTALGFNYDRGRIDKSLHPFCSGNGKDIRMTTRFDEDNPLDSLFSSIHETGHGLYEQGLPLDQLHTALGQAAGMGVHESQSRLWENQVCRSQAFWKFYEPKFRERFPKQLQGINSEDLYLAINAVSRNPIRVDSDEVTYNIHIIIRFEIENALFNDSLKIDELPDYWNARYQELLGITPGNDREGVLQDIHWSGGAFGYFPSYCLGNMMAAQLWYAALDQIDGLEKQISNGEFAPLLTWLRKNIHAHGQSYPLKELCLKATGNELSPQALVRYLKERYLPLYR